MSNPNRATLKARNASVVAGIDKRITGDMGVGGVVYTPAELKQVFLDENTAIDAAEALYKQWQDQVQATREASRRSRQTFRLLRSSLIGQYGENAKAVLNDFGMEAPKPKGPKTVAAKVVAAQKRDATRAVRHTMGKNQKKKVKGTKEVPVTPQGETT